MLSAWQFEEFGKFTTRDASDSGQLARLNAIQDMVSIAFGSVGDIIAICQVIAATVRSLSSTIGSSTEYESLINSLWSLAQALESVKSLIEQGSQLPHQGRLQTVLGNCHECLDRELDNIRIFAASLRSAGSSNRLKDAIMKIRWQGQKARSPLSFFIVSGKIQC